MAVSASMNVYGNYHAYTKVIDWTDASVKVVLCSAGDLSMWTNRQALQHMNNGSAQDPESLEVATGSGYTTRGKVLTTPTATVSTSVLKLDADDTAWTGLTKTFRYAVVYYDTADYTTSPVIALIDFGADIVATNETFTIIWSGSGICTITSST